MSFEWSDEEMEVVEEENKGEEKNKEKEEEGKSLDYGTLKELTEQYEASQKELDRLNRVGIEVKRALELRQKMEMCAMRADLGIKLEVKVVTVFDESMLVYLDVKSDLDWVLEEWDLLLTMHPIQKTNEVLPCSSSSHRIPTLAPSSSHSILVLQLSDPSQWPTVLRPSIVKRFHIREQSSYILNIPLPSLLISHLLIFKPIPEAKKSKQKSCITLPTEFFSKFIEDSLPLGMGTVMNETVFISTEELAKEKKMRIDIYSSSSTVRQSIITSLEGRSVLAYPRYCPSFSPVLPIPSLQSLNALFNSIFPN